MNAFTEKISPRASSCATNVISVVGGGLKQVVLVPASLGTLIYMCHELVIETMKMRDLPHSRLQPRNFSQLQMYL